MTLKYLGVPPVPTGTETQLAALLNGLKENIKVIQDKINNIINKTADTLKLGKAAFLDVGTTAGTVAAGDDSRFAAISGGSSILSVVTITTPTSSVAFSGDYSACPALRIIISGKLTNYGSALWDTIYVKFNSDAVAANYGSSTLQYSISGTVGSSAYASTTDGAAVGTIATSYTSLQPVTALEIVIPNPSGALHKVGSTKGATIQDTVGVYNVILGFIWKSTAPITALTLKTRSTTFAAGTKIYLLGA